VVLWDSDLKKNIGVGYYDEETDAARAYDREAIKRKLFIKLNFYDFPELLADKSVGALAAIASAAVVGSAGASTSASTSTRASKFEGVQYNSKNNRWRARIHVNNVRTELGRYVNEEDAAHAYAVAKRGIQYIPQNNNFVKLLSYRATNEANDDELFTVRPRYTSDELVQTTVFFYYIYRCVYEWL